MTVRPVILAAGAKPPPSFVPPFMSFPKDTSQFSDGRLRFDNVNNFTITDTSFTTLVDPTQGTLTDSSDITSGVLGRQTNIAIVLLNCDDVTIRRCDFRRVSEPIFAFNCDRLVVEDCRFENILGPNHRGFGSGAGHYGNFLQLDNCDSTIVRDVKGRYGDCEDVISHFRSGGSLIQRFQFEGASSITRSTTDATDAIVPGWLANGGWPGFVNPGATTSDGPIHCPVGFGDNVIASTGMIFGDQSPSNGSLCEDSIFINSGRVPLHVTGGVDNLYDNCIVYSGKYTTGMGSRVGDGMDQNHAEPVSIFNAQPAEPCSGHKVTNSRTWYDKCDGSTNPSAFCSGCGSCDFTGTVFGDVTLDIDDWRVDLSDYVIPVV